MRQVTLLFLLKDDHICLAMKKRGFGMGKLNGMGGKVEDGESVEAAAVREVHEEVGVSVAIGDATKVAELHFVFDGKPDWELFCHTYIARRWEGEPKESSEMAPQWVPRDAIPYSKMWADDKYWLPLVLRGENVKASFQFSEDGSKVLRYDITGAPRHLWTN